MRGRRVAILETRTGQHLAELVARRGGIPMRAPALHEVPDLEPRVVADLLSAWRVMPYGMVIFQTGVGTRALFNAAEALGSGAALAELLAQAVVVVRGPKPLAELNSRQVRVDLKAPSPFTTDTVLSVIAPVELCDSRVLVQRYGAPNEPLRHGLEARGAAVDEIATYRWALPDDLQPLIDLLDALAASHVDAVVFTSAVQIQNLHAVALAQGRADLLADYLSGPVIASIGPVCTRALRAHGITPTFEAAPPKLGPLLAGLETALIARG
jgi:uroporphyrinogen-III synthase